MGWEWDYVWTQIDWPIYVALRRQWEREPPANASMYWIMRFLGYKPPPPRINPKKSKKLTADMAEKLLGMFGGGVIK